MSGARVLVVEDDAALSEVLCEELAGHGHLPQPARSVSAALAALDAAEFEVVLLDLGLPDGDGIDVLRHVSEHGLACEVLVLTGHGSVSSAVDAIRLGAYDYLSKPAALDELEVLVGRAAEKSRLRRDNASLRARLDRHEPPVPFVAGDSAMSDVVDLVDRAAASDIPVVVAGPRGSGKDRVARLIHARSRRSDGPFVAFDSRLCAGTQAAHELFGSGTPGLLEVANGGTLFVDDVEALDAAVLGRLLRALDSGEYVPDGGRRVRRTDVRLICATSCGLDAEGRPGGLGRETWDRLAGLVLRLPPLASRPGDIRPLASAFLGEQGRRASLDEEAAAVLMGYAWPGNVRELRMVVHRAALLAGEGHVDAVAVRSALGTADGVVPSLTPPQLEREFLSTVTDGGPDDAPRPATDPEAPKRKG